MEKYDKDQSMSDRSIHNACCIKTEDGNDSNIADVSYHDLHCIKTESGSDTHMDGDMEHDLHCIKKESGSDTHVDGDMEHDLHCIKAECDINGKNAEFNNLKPDCTKTGQAFVGLDTKPYMLYIKSEPQDVAPMEYYHQNTSEYTQSEAVKPESVQTVLRAGNNNPNLLRMCDDNQTQSYEAHEAALEGECLKHEHTSCEDTKPSDLQLSAAGGDESNVTGDKPYKCDQCTKSFSDKYNLVRHIQVHTVHKPYQCEQCTKSFSQKGNLVTHIRVHTGDKPYTCEQCTKSFSQKGDLVRHIRVHTGAKPYTCGQCQKSFSQSSGLASHVRIHTHR
jgi:hypothetical protein